MIEALPALITVIAAAVVVLLAPRPCINCGRARCPTRPPWHDDRCMCGALDCPTCGPLQDCYYARKHRERTTTP